MRQGRILIGAGGGRDPRSAIASSRAQEKAVAKDLKGGRVQVGSGARWHSKADVKSDHHLVECKQTSHASYSLKLDEWLKVKFEAIGENKRAVMAVQIRKEKLAVLSWDDYVALLEQQTDEDS